MGIFSSEYETSVATTVSRVIPEHALPNSLKTGLTKSLFGDDGQMLEHTMEDLASGIGIRAGNMHNYGKNTYIFGLPESAVLTSTVGHDLVKSIIETEVGSPVTFNYYNPGTLNYQHVGWLKLVTNHGYKQSTNLLGALSLTKGTPVYLKNMVVVVKDSELLVSKSESLLQWGDPVTAGPSPERSSQTRTLGVLRAHSPIEVDATSPHNYIRVDYSWVVNTTVLVEGVEIAQKVIMVDSFQIPLTGYNENADFHQVKYILNDEAYYWLYQADAGLHTDLDLVYNPEFSGTGNYFPWIYFRYGKTSGVSNQESTWFRHSEKLAGYLGMDYDSVTTAIHENPGIADVEQAMLMMSVPANTSNPHEIRYLFDYFDELHESTGGSLQPSQPASILKGIFDNGGIFGKLSNRGGIVIQDDLFKMSLGFGSVYKRKVGGILGKVGTHAMQLGSENGSSVHIYRRQVTDILYEEIKVTSLRMTYFIYGGHNTVGTDGSAILLIPIDKSITDRYSATVREVLYSRSLHFIFNSVTVTEVKWYEQSWFSTFLLIVAVVITVISLGKGYQTISLALAAGATATAVAMMIAIGVLKYIAISIAIRLFVKAVGAEVAFLIALIATVYSGYRIYQAGSVAGAPWAKELLQVSTSLSSEVSAELQRNFNSLRTETLTFGTAAEAQQKKLDDANKLLENSNYLTPMIIFGEKPQDFYQRTVHSGNIGVLGLDAISSYVDVALTLPKLTDTL